LLVDWWIARIDPGINPGILAIPVAANVVDSIDEYPGISSWKMFRTGSHVKEVKRISRSALTAVRLDATNDKEEDRARLNYWLRRARTTSALRIDPYIWKRCFHDSSSWTDNEIYDRLINAVRERESDAVTKRNGTCLGSERLRAQTPWREYEPKPPTPTPFV